MGQTNHPVPSTRSAAIGKTPISADDPEFCRQFKRLCISDILVRTEQEPLYWQELPLNWDASHEIYAFHEYSGRRIPTQRLLVMSNCRNQLMDQLWPKGPLTREAVETFYQKSAFVLPWGHGQFKSNHDVAGRQTAWLRRVRLLQMLKQHQVRSLCDYGAGCGYTALLAATMGFERVIHYEYSVFQPYVKWRSERMSAADQARGRIEWVTAEHPLEMIKEPVEAIICTDVAEHVWDPHSLLRQIHKALRSDGLLVWASCFGEGLSSHLHPHLKGKEDALLSEAGFEYFGPLPDEYINHCGLYRAVPTRPKMSIQTVSMPRQKSQLLERQQWFGRKELEQYQWRWLQSLLRHAYAHSHYYRKQWEKLGMCPNDIQTPEDFSRLPILTKAQIQDHKDALCADTWSREQLIRNATGGSTGQPLVFFRDQNAQEWIKAAKQRFRNWLGYDESSDKVAFMWGADRDIPVVSNSNHRWLNAFNCSEADIKRFIEELVQWRPKAIRGYASCLAMTARLIRQNGWKAPIPKAIESAAEKIHPDERKLVEKVFQCPVYEVYGSREIPVLACECSAHNGMHIFSDLRWMEVIRDDGLPAEAGREGRLIVTDLVNYGMPFIRYEIGDIGVLSDSDCSCGRAFGLLKEVKGRLSDMIHTPDGRVVHGEYFTHLFYHITGVKSFQVRQKSLSAIHLYVEPAASFNAAMIESAVHQMKKHLGDNVQIHWKTVDDIPKTISGKRRFVISELDNNVRDLPAAQTLSQRKSTRGIVFVAFGKEYDRVAAHTACYSRRFTDLPFYVLTNLKKRSEKWDDVGGVEFRFIDEDADNNRGIRTSVVDYTPFDETLVLDCDAVIRKPGIEQLFDYLKRHDLVFVELMKFPKTMDSFFEAYYKPIIDAFSLAPKSLVSGAVFAFRKTEFSESFFSRWNALWVWAGKTRDMPPLMGVLEMLAKDEKGGVEILTNDERTLRVLNLDNRGICCDDEKSIIHHRFRDAANTWFKRYGIPVYTMNKPWDRTAGIGGKMSAPAPDASDSKDRRHRGDKTKTIAMIVSIPERAAALRYVLCCIAPQVDDIRILLNGCEQVPEDLYLCRKISQILTDPSGKLFASGVWNLLKPDDDGYVLILDDDIVYPPDYVAAMVGKIEQYRRRAVVVVHAMEFKEPFMDYRKDRTVCHFGQQNHRDQPAHAGGVGTSAFHTDTLRPQLSDFPNPNYRDLWFAILAARKNVPVVCIARNKGWLLGIKTHGKTIWKMSEQADWRAHKNAVFRQHLLPLLIRRGLVRSDMPATPAALPENTAVPSTDSAGPKVSVIVACRDEETRLTECLDSIRAQTLTDWELLIVDDGSTDRTREILKTYAANDSRIRLWFFDDQKGPYARRNFAIRQSRAPYVSIQDADDIMMPEKLARLHERIGRDDRLGIVGSWYRKFLDFIPGIEYGDCIVKRLWHDEIMEVFPETLHLCWHGSAVIRKTLFDQVGLFSENPWGSDSFWLAKAGMYGYLTQNVRFENLSDCLTLKREHDDSQTGHINPFDPRSRRHLVADHYRKHLLRIGHEFRQNPGIDVTGRLRDCSVQNYIDAGRQLFEKHESAPVTDAIRQYMLKWTDYSIQCGWFVTGLMHLNLLEAIDPDIARKCTDFHFIRALSLYAAGHDGQAAREIERLLDAQKNRFQFDFSIKNALERKRRVPALYKTSQAPNFEISGRISTAAERIDSERCGPTGRRGIRQPTVVIEG